MSEIIYVLINGAMPGYVKIGRTTNLERRIRELDNTSIPLPFECVYACAVENAEDVEALIHDGFLDHRTRTNREFFEISPDRAISILKLREIENVTPQKDFVESEEDQQAINQARTRRERFNFNMVGIPAGAELYLYKDNNIKATVIDNRYINYEGSPMSLSAAAKEALDLDYVVAGTACWMYEGETLDERRRRLEEEG